MSWAEGIALALLGSLTLYVLLGGADFGAGVWDWLSFGPRARAQRELLRNALNPVWEANHVWLILAVVLLFTAFPPAFAYLAVVLHVPLSLALLGIVLRGGAFVLRQHGPGHGAGHDDARWRRVFELASVMTPFFLGIVAGNLLHGPLPEIARMGARDYLWGWASPSAFGTGALLLLAGMFLAAVYATSEPADARVREDFRLRALLSGAVLWLALLAFPPERVPLLLRIVALAAGAAALAALWTRRFRLARALAIAEIAGLMAGWGAAQYPYLIHPTHAIHAVAAPEVTLRLLAGALVLGGLVLFPSLYWLLRVFKGRAAPSRQ